MKRLISLPTAFIVLFLIFVTPAVLSADSKNLWQDNSCIKELKNRVMPWEKGIPWQAWQQQVSKVFVGEVVRAQPRKEAGDIDCGIGTRDVKHRITEVLMGDMKLGSEIKLDHRWCGPGKEIYFPEAKFIIGLNTRVDKNFSETAPPNGAIAWGLPFNPENRGNAETFIQCIQDLGLVKAMEKEKEK